MSIYPQPGELVYLEEISSAIALGLGHHYPRFDDLCERDRRRYASMEVKK